MICSARITLVYSTLVSIILALIPQVVSTETGACAAQVNARAGINEHAERIGKKLASTWRCSGQTSADIELTFRLTKDGYPYNLHLAKGYENPFAIRSALHAVLFGMPFDNPNGVTLNQKLVRCTMSGDSRRPSVKVSLSDSAVPKGKSESAALKSVPLARYKHQTFLFGPMATRLNSLCECLFDFPDSSELCKEIGILCSNIGLNTDDAHAWVCIARSRGTDLSTMRNSLDNDDIKDSKAISNLPPLRNSQNNPDLKDPGADPDFLPLSQRSCRRAAIAAYLQAWKLKKEEAILHELEAAYARYFALEIRSAANGNPLLLGNAALLSEQLYLAREKYGQAMARTDPLAERIVAQMGGVDVGELAALKLTPKFLPTNWKAVLRCLPTDTELVAVERLSSREAPSQHDQRGLFSPLVATKRLTEGCVSDAQMEVNKLFAGAHVAFALHAARTFKEPVGLGVGSSDGVDILAFGKASKLVPMQVMNKVRANCIYRQSIEGVEVQCFYQEPFTYGRFESSRAAFSGTQSYICSPYEGVLLSATNIEYLRELLIRLRVQPDDRALPDNLPEWQQIDTGADSWALRHYDKAYLPFDIGGTQALLVAAMFESSEQSTTSSPEHGQLKQPASQEPGQSLKTENEVGFLFYKTGNKITIKSLSRNDSTLKGQAKFWRDAFEYNEGHHAPNVDVKCVIDEGILTVEGNITPESHIVLMLFLSLGYFVAG